MKKYIGSSARTIIIAGCGFVLGLYFSNIGYTISEIGAIVGIIVAQAWSWLQKHNSN